MSYIASRRVQCAINTIALSAIAVAGFFYIPLLKLSDEDPIIALLSVPSPFLLGGIYLVISVSRLLSLSDKSVTPPGIILTAAGMVPLFIVSVIIGMVFWAQYSPEYIVRFA